MSKLLGNGDVQGGNVKNIQATLLHNSHFLAVWVLTLICSTSSLAETTPYTPEIIVPAPQISTDAIDPDKVYYYRDLTNQLNESWLNNGQEKSYEGSAALGKLLKMGVKATYKSFKDRGSLSNKMPDENGNGSLANMKYKLRMKSDTIKLGFEYKF